MLVLVIVSVIFLALGVRSSFVFVTNQDAVMRRVYQIQALLVPVVTGPETPMRLVPALGSSYIPITGPEMPQEQQHQHQRR